MEKKKDKKRVRCLYRVSTKQQLHDDDIPLQRKECLGYIKKHEDWVFDCEYIEKGVSGYNKSTQEREVLMEIQEAADKGEFEVLLVYMSDRIGRRESETPFYIAALGNLGIEIWSVTEGEISSREYIGRLINYVRSWLAEGESRKTGMRVRDAQINMIKDGKTIGGYAPFGYDRKPTGRTTNHGRMEHDLFINEEQAEIVRMIFDLAVNNGYGALKIAKELNAKCIPNCNGNEWKSTTVGDMLKNPIYMGLPTYGRRQREFSQYKKLDQTEWIVANEINPQYQIVSRRVFETAQKMREARKAGIKKAKENNMGAYPTSTSGTLALLDIAYCGYCGKKLTNGSRYDYWITKDGEKRRKVAGRYRCNSKAQGETCEGRQVYKQEEIETIVFDVVGEYLDRLGKDSVYDEILKMQEQQKKVNRQKLENKRKQLKSIEKDLQTLEEQIPAAIRGEIPISLEKISSLLNEKEEQQEQEKKSLASLEEEFVRSEINVDDLRAYKNLVIDWKEVFQDAPVSMKRVMLNKLIERIDVRRDDINIKFKMNLKDFIPLNTIDKRV